jgi:hypothetical protein
LDGANRGQPLSISIVKQAQTSNNNALESVEDENELLPPLTFEATVLDPNSVKLEWKPNTHQRADEVFYLINIKQLTSNSGTENLLRQQVIFFSYQKHSSLIIVFLDKSRWKRIFIEQFGPRRKVRNDYKDRYFCRTYIIHCCHRRN